jgi:hypothetical protein
MGWLTVAGIITGLDSHSQARLISPHHGMEHRRQGHTAPASGLLLPSTHETNASTDRLVAALVITVQQASLGWPG